jgi:hypothetical protein
VIGVGFENYRPFTGARNCPSIPLSCRLLIEIVIAWARAASGNVAESILVGSRVADMQSSPAGQVEMWLTANARQ